MSSVLLVTRDPITEALPELFPMDPRRDEIVIGEADLVQTVPPRGDRLLSAAAGYNGVIGRA